MITLDGNYLEGGGQIIRTATALSILTQKPFTVNNIRAKRPQPGLKAQHLHTIKAFETLANAKVEHCELGSTDLIFHPGPMNPQTLNVDVGTAGSVTLVLQSLALACLFSPGKYKLKIIGGTDVTWSPRWDYFAEVMVPQFQRYADIEVKLLKRGYYPKGQGSVEVSIHARHPLQPAQMQQKESQNHADHAPHLYLTEQGALKQIKGISHASKDLEHAQVAERQAKSAANILSQLIKDCPIDIQAEYANTESTGSGLTLYAAYSHLPDQIDTAKPIRIGADVLGERGKSAEEVARECCDKLFEEMQSHAPVDEHLADNLIPILGLVGGKIKTSYITTHTKTNIYVVEKFLDVKFKIDEQHHTIEVGKEHKQEKNEK